MRRGCVGLFSSPDMENWTVHPPLFAPRRYWDLECPQVFQIGDWYYLTSAIMEDRTQRYWVAERFEGPYEVPADGGMLAPLGHYAGRICRWKDEDLYLCWHEPRPQNRGRVPLPAVDWATVRNPAGKFVVAPLELTPRTGRQPRLSLLLGLGDLPHRGTHPVDPNASITAPQYPHSSELLAGRKRWRWDGPSRE